MFKFVEKKGFVQVGMRNKKTLTIKAIFVLISMLVIGVSLIQASGGDTTVSLEPPDYTFAATAVHSGGDGFYPEINGPQHWAVLMCKFSDVASEPQNQSFFEQMFERTNGPSLHNYWREVSYNNITEITADAHCCFTLPNDRAFYNFSSSSSGYDVEAIIQDCIDVADPSVNFAPYDAVAVMLNSDAPVAITSLFPLNYPDGALINLGAISIPSNKYNLALVAHEMGHAYFFPHSSANGNVYQNPWDVMGIASGYHCSVNADPIYSCLGQHPIMIYKDQAGWIAPERRYEAPTGTSTIALERSAQPPAGNYLVAIVTAGSKTYYVEARKQVGYDTKLAGNAVIIHNNDDLIDTNGAPYDDDGAMWIPGETFTDAANDIEITVDSETATGFVITIKNGTDPHVEADLFASPTVPATNEAVTFTTQLSYVDGGLDTVATTISVTIPTEMTVVSDSVTTSAGTVISQDPPIVSIPALGATAVTVQYKATVNANITDPTPITIPVAIQWGDQIGNYSHNIIANGEQIYLPFISKP